MARFLVVGNALAETIRRTQDGAGRRHVGGVGAIMARELAHAGADVTFLTTAPAGRHAGKMQAALEKRGVKPVILPGAPAQTTEGQATIMVKNGGPLRAKGNWPRMGGLRKEIAELAPEFDWTLVSMTLSDQDLREAAGSSPNLAVNATAKSMAGRIPSIGPHRISTMNEQERAALMNSPAPSRRGKDLRQVTGAETVMVTMGRRGRRIYLPDGTSEEAPAGPVPEGADFIGAGDSATAGLVYATALGLDIGETIDRFISELMRRNAQAYRAQPK